MPTPIATVTYKPETFSSTLSNYPAAAFLPSVSAAGANAWFASDPAGASPIDAKLIWGSGTQALFDVELASASPTVSTKVYTFDGDKPGGYGTDPYDANLIQKWPLAGNLTAAKGTDQSALTGTVTFGTNSFFGAYGIFNGSAATRATGISTFTAGTPQTQSLWIRKAGTVGAADYWIANRDGATGGLSSLDDNANVSKASGYVGSTAEVISATTVADSDWHHVAFTYNGGGSGSNVLRILVNGVLDATITNETFTWTTTSSWFLGARGNGAGGATLYMLGDMALPTLSNVVRADAWLRADALLQGPNAADYVTVTPFGSTTLRRVKYGIGHGLGWGLG